MDDATLLARIGQRDERAMEAVSARFSASMHAVALRVTRSDHFAEEAVQDALLAVWQDPGRYDPARGALKTWLLTLARHKAIDAVRREQVIRRRTADVDLESRQAPDDVHDEVWLGIRRERLMEAVGRLGPDQRRALELAFLGGLTHVEVAAREGIPLGTAKTRIRSALLKLRQELASSLGREPEAAPAPTLEGPIRRAPPSEPGAHGGTIEWLTPGQEGARR